MRCPRASAASEGGAWDPVEAANVLAMAARRRWENLSPMVDDITAIIIDVTQIHG